MVLKLALLLSLTLTLIIEIQVEDKSREIERLRGSLGTAEARLGGLEGRWI